MALFTEAGVRGAVVRLPRLPDDDSARALSVPSMSRRPSFSQAGLRLPRWVWATAIIVSLVRLIPFWHAEIQTPAGWSFTGNIDGSGDMMQYRAWMRQAQETGPLVTNKFTPEPTDPFIPVVLYWVVGGLSKITGVSAEYVYTYLGSLFALALIVTLYWTLSLFLSNTRQVRWAFLAILVGGGLGAHFRVIAAAADRLDSTFFSALAQSVRTLPVLENDRGHYVVTTIFDTHFLYIWLIVTLAVLATYSVVRRPTVQGALLLVVADAVVTISHIYSGVNLVAVTAAVLFCVKGRSPGGGARWALAITVLTVAVVGGVQLLLYKSSTLPTPNWSTAVYPHELFLAFPLAWILLVAGRRWFLREGGLRERFVAGWLLGCTVLALSAPVYPYAERATITLQIPLYFATIAIYFGLFGWQRWWVGVVAVTILCGTPAIMVHDLWVSTSFSDDKPYVFESTDHRAIIERLGQDARSTDVLLVEKSGRSRRHADLWLAPEFPGRMYRSHFFLTARYSERVRKVEMFFAGTPGEQLRFLQHANIRFIFVDSATLEARLEQVPGIVLLTKNSAGALYRYG